MKTNEFFEMMGKIDPALIERADKMAVKKRPLVKIAAIAAAFALLAGLTIAVLPSMVKGDETIEDVVVWANIFTMFSPANEDGLISGEIDTSNEAEIVIAESAFAEIISDDYADYIIGTAIPTAQNGVTIGEKLGEIEIRTGWYLHYDDRERDVVTVKAELYEIKGVSPDAAVAVKYLEIGVSNTTEHYYAAVNTEYGFTTLADFLDDFNAEVHMNIGEDVYLAEYELNLSGKSEEYLLKDGAGSDIVKILLGFDAESEIEGYYDEPDEKTTGCDEILRFTFAMNSAGKTRNFLYVFDNGYIAIQGFCDGYAFFNVGCEATDMIFELHKNNAEIVKAAAGDPDGDGLVEATTSAPINEAVPE